VINIKDIINYLKNYQGPQVKLMEVCGTHTGSIFKHGINSLISPKIRLISGPGCPVCVTPANFIDQAVDYACQPDFVFCTYGDMMRVPGTKANITLKDGKAAGAQVEMIYSPLEVLEKAAAMPQKTFIIGAVGFETTVPLYALLLEEMENRGIKNIKFLTALKTIAPAMAWICQNEKGNRSIDGFLCPGHVSVVMGENIYQDLVHQYQKPCAIAGFSAEHILAAIYDLVRQIETQRGEIHNLYREVVKPEGNVQAQKLMERFFSPVEAHWRGLGKIPGSGLKLREQYQEFDLGFEGMSTLEEDSRCRCGSIITGSITPDQCLLFGTACTPNNPQGPCMVSTEGTCGIWAQHMLKKKKNWQQEVGKEG
jgi:hydrogenase expression/formation protein HypD